MTLVSGDSVLRKAQKGKYAVGAFNVNNLEMLQGIMAAAEKMKSPVILQTSEGAIAYAGLHNLKLLIEEAARHSTVPIVMHLDHGRDLKLIKQCIDLGYTSIMYDGSHLSFEDNVANTKKVVAWAHAKGASVEAELGTIGGAEDTVSSRHILLTDPPIAKKFVQLTKCDSLAIAIGTSHGAYKFSGTAKLDIGRLQVIRKLVSVPLVLHGASAVPSWLVKKAESLGAQLGHPEGVPEDQVQRAIEHGICKINTDTDLRLAFTTGIRAYLSQHRDDIDPRHLLNAGKALLEQVVEHRIRLFGSEGKGR